MTHHQWATAMRVWVCPICKRLDLAAELHALDAAALEAGITDERVLAALEEDEEKK